MTSKDETRASHKRGCRAAPVSADRAKGETAVVDNGASAITTDAAVGDAGAWAAIMTVADAKPSSEIATRLLREWGGETYEVTVLDEGFLWKDKTWKSLSAIAETITGVHWSGPRFFGLKKRPSLSIAPKDSEGTSSTSQVTPMASDLREESADA